MPWCRRWRWCRLRGCWSWRHDAARFNRLRSASAARPSGDFFQQRLHSGAVRSDRTCLPHSVHGSNEGRSPACRRRKRATFSRDESRGISRPAWRRRRSWQLGGPWWRQPWRPAAWPAWRSSCCRACQQRPRRHLLRRARRLAVGGRWRESCLLISGGAHPLRPPYCNPWRTSLAGRAWPVHKL